MYNHDSSTIRDMILSAIEGDLAGCNPGTLYQTVHNRKYMEEHPEIVDITKLKDEDLHDWKLVGEVVEPTLEKDGYADYICSIDKCGQTKHVVLPKLTPDTQRTGRAGRQYPGYAQQAGYPQAAGRHHPGPCDPGCPCTGRHCTG